MQVRLLVLKIVRSTKLSVGACDDSASNTTYDTFPTVYLKDEVIYISGEVSASSPYQVGLQNN